MPELKTLQRALLTIKKLKQQEQERNKQSFQPIAIVGMSCRLPQADTLAEFWDLLLQGKSVVSQYPDKRWQLLKNSQEETLRKADHLYWGGFLDDITGFDAYFFGISPREALRMDPQQRILLEVAYEAFADAGMTTEHLASSNTGVFASLYASQIAHLQQLDSDLDALYLPTGNATSIAANRISYLFDLRGPSMVIDTACSSSLVAIQTAIVNIQQKLCDQAIVCGININLLPSINYVLAQAKMLSPVGKCKTFAADADGYVQGEGAGAIILKPLDKALKDRDRIYAVIAGGALNQDGKTNGMTAPNGLQQEQLIKQAYQTAGIDPKEASYVECHGTGTFLGDPIEMQALGAIIGKDRDPQLPCWIGSVKTNLGHLEPAAGIVSVIKTALSLRYGKIPAHLNFSAPNPHIEFAKYHLQVPQTTQFFPEQNSQHIASISGFGFGGANAHLVLRNVTETRAEQITEIKAAEIFTLAAKNMEALIASVQQWREQLQTNPEIDLAQLCHNLHLRRSHYVYRLAIIARSTAELLATLAKINDTESVLPTNVFICRDKTSPANINITYDNPEIIAAAYVSGANIDWKKYEANRRYEFQDMPVYPWQHKIYWPEIKTAALTTETSNYPLRGKSLASPLSALQFEFRLDNKSLPDMPDTFNVLHAGYYLEMLAFVANQINGKPTFRIEDHHFLSPLFVLNDAVVTVHAVLEKIASDIYSYSIYSTSNEQTKWILHAKGLLNLDIERAPKIADISTIRANLPINEPAAKLYERVLAMGMPAGDSIRWTHQYWRGSNEILSEFRQPESTNGKNEHFALQIHPGIIDATIQPIFILLPDETRQPYIASHVTSACFYGMQAGPYYLYGILKANSDDSTKLSGDCYLLTAANQVIAAFNNVTLTQLDNKFDMQSIVQAKGKTTDLASLPQQERKRHVIEFLLEQASIIFSMPVKDIDITIPLTQMGIDSLMALVLMRTLETGLGVNYSLQELMNGPSLYQLAERILTQALPNDTILNEQNTTPTPWIAYRQPQSHARVKLFCFPYGGGGASIYRGWQNEISDAIEICPVQIPGRESRMNEIPHTNLKLLIDELLQHLSHELTQPFAFFGHSFGALIAFELARELRRRGLPQPAHLFVSAFPDPRLPAKSLNKMLQQLQDAEINLFTAQPNQVIDHLDDDKLSALSDILNANGINQYGDNLKERDISKALLPIFCGDMGIVHSYQFQSEEPLEVAITVFAGKQDTWVAYEDHLPWHEHTRGQYQIHTFDSGHLFIKEDVSRRNVLEKIQRALTL